MRRASNEIRSANGDDPYQFDYILMCNKICGSAHYNMKMKVSGGNPGGI
ncbi:MAG: hypothetical protein U5L96_19930 [Owenweeksia sp.]|nr:hypothetical protein [Owenweeksia sp.]